MRSLAPTCPRAPRSPSPLAPVSLALLSLCAASGAFAGANPHFTLPLHGIWPATFQETCDTPFAQGVDCTQNGRPTVDIAGGATGPAVIYFLAYNHAALRGVQTAFDWTPWTIIFQNWSCQGQIVCFPPMHPGGPIHGVLNTAFRCVTDPRLLVVGYMVMNITAPGCFSQVEPMGSTIQALDCDLELDELVLPGPDEQRLGKVCVGTGGRDACDRVVPVVPTTWGDIKAQYR